MALTITTKSGDVLTASADAVILPVMAGAGVPTGLDGAERFDGHLASALEATGFTGKQGQVASVPTFGKLPARTLVLTGIGEGGDPALRGESLRRAYGAAIKRAQESGARTVAAALPEGADADAISAVVEGLTLALYRFAQYKSSNDTSKDVGSVALWSSGAVTDDAVAHGQAIAAGVALARDLVNMISNDKTPPQIAAWAQRVARESGLPCEVLDEKALASGGYNSILAVGKGSAAPPRLIEMVYEPSGGATKTVALVGKTITFDSGGLDLEGQDEHVFDEDGHGRRGGGPRSDAGDRGDQAECAGDRHHGGGGEHAERHGDAPERRGDGAERQDIRDRQHGRGRADGAGGRGDARGAGRGGRDHRYRHADRRMSPSAGPPVA